MRLMAHAGLNALGYPGRSELYYPAERWGWRSYNEGVGVNTFSPVIEFASDAEIEGALLKEAEHNFESRDMNSATLVLASVGEEAGYKDGWGKTYYWDKPVAPDLVALWRALGVTSDGVSVRLDDAAPLANVRHAIMRAPQ